MDGGFEIFLVLMFVFWILESIAKARQKPRPPMDLPEGLSGEQRSPDEQRTSFETRLPSDAQVPAGRRLPTAQRIPDRGQKPPTLLEILAAELQRAKEAQRQAGEGSADRSTPIESRATTRRAPAGPESSVSAPPPHKARLAPQHARTAPRRAPARATAKHPQPPPRPSGGLGSGLGSAAKPPSRVAVRGKKPDLVLRGERQDDQEQFAERDPQERTSSAWASGLEAERGSTRESERGTSLEADRAAGLETKRAESLELAPSARRHGLQRAGIKETQRPLEAGPRNAAAAAAHSLDPRHLVGASPAQLRQILILNEVLGPPVGLRDPLQ